MKNIKLLEEMLQEQSDIMVMTNNQCNKSKYEGMLLSMVLLGYDVTKDNKIIKN